MEEILILGAAISGIVFAIIELIKSTESIPKKWLPPVGLVIGLLAGYFSYPFSSLGVEMRLWAGLVAALGATGFFELVKPVKTIKKSEDK